ncbi:hypothetical protein TRAPUB_1909 [Trametes pubescens]|uniref:NADH-ubiquinone oxidoreductase 9.5 kDa subunit n=1 Tax=Trametes pubescens TaxID=154538 RepID=A0A1M2VI35_TRAPU|nr:hypothetical protein TRAPUB_1909 [Trametes pubescens]
MASLFSFRQTYRYLQRQAHEQPVIFYSLVIGLIGPVMLITVPPIRKTLGYRYADPIPTSYPGESLSSTSPGNAEERSEDMPSRNWCASGTDANHSTQT